LFAGTVIAETPAVVMWSSIKMLETHAVRLTVGGSLDVTTVPELEQTMTIVINRQPWQVQLELSRLRMIDSVGVGALLRFHKRLQSFGCAVTISHLCEQPLAMFRLLKLDERLLDERSDRLLN
jgi:anti-sigma B factor antagonist